MKKLLFAMCILLTACQPSVEMVQKAIAQTQAEYTPTPEPTATVTPIENSSWRVPMMQGMTTYNFDHIASVDFEKKIDGQLAFFKVERPIRWDTYSIERIDKPTDITKYYENILSRRGYKVDVSIYEEDNKIGWAIFTNQEKRIYLEYWLDKKSPLILVIYKNVD